MKFRKLRTGMSLLLSVWLMACGGGSGGGGAGTGNAGTPDTEDSGPPLLPGEMSNAGDSTLTDGDPVDDAPGTPPVAGTPDAGPVAGPPDTLPPEQPLPDGASGVALIAGLWDDSFTYPDGRVNITYLEITTDGRYVNHDFRGDSFDLGENCYETVEGVIVADSTGSYTATVLGEEFRFEATSSAGQLQVRFADGGSAELAAVTGLSTSDFNEC